MGAVQKTAKKSLPASHVFEIVAKLEAYSGTCGSVARSGIGGLKRAGRILLVRSSAGELFHVELGGSGRQLTVTRVSSGGIARDLEKAILRAARRPAGRGGGSELRMLRVPAMHISAVWLHHPRRGADVFLPYTHNFAGLRVGRTCNLPGIERLLKQHATYMILRWYEGYEKTIRQPKV